MARSRNKYALLTLIITCLHTLQKCGEHILHMLVDLALRDDRLLNQLIVDGQLLCNPIRRCTNKWA